MSQREARESERERERARERERERERERRPGNAMAPVALPGKCMQWLWRSIL